MISQLFDEIRGLEGVRFHQGADSSLVVRFENDYGIVLPDDHKDVLKRSNGLEVFGGYYRLFGAYTSECIDSVVWNQAETWKFAWGNRCAGFWSFGETAWGDQYAYSVDSLREGDAKVYLLECSSMTPRVWSASFSEFFEKEFLLVAKVPYDIMTRQAHQKFGPIETDCHVVYIPSLLLDGTEDIKKVEKMNARAAMICNGDIAMGLDAAADEQVLKEIQTYEDDLHRTRLRLVWA
jgi:SMI1 / KNR4 family (SUKH-1)